MKAQDFEQFKTFSDLQDFLLATGAAKTRTQARQDGLAMVPRELSFQNDIRKYLESIPGGFVWREQTGAYCTAGRPDLLFCLNGQLYGFEVKRPFVGKLSALQEKITGRMREAGARVFVVTYVSEVRKALGRE